jgi:predicted transcriptional regulator
MSESPRIDLTALRAELARRGMTQVDLALVLRVSPTTLSGHLRGRHPAPSDLIDRIESVLGIQRGTLCAARQP